MSWAWERAVKHLVKSLPLPATRRDGWINIAQGLGTVLSDKVANTAPTSFTALSDIALTAMYHGDSTVRKACHKLPDTSLSLGMQVNVPDDGGGAEVATAFQDAFDVLHAVHRFKEACTWERLYGGAVIFMALDDGNRGWDSQELPVNWDGLKQVLWLRTIDRRYIRRSMRLDDIDLDPTSPLFGQPTHYELVLGPRQTRMLRIHRDRLILFPGESTTVEQREYKDGWGISCLDPVYEALQRCITSWQTAGNVFAGAQYAVYKLKGLSSMLQIDGGEQKMQKRSQAIELAKSMVHAVLIDSEDEYTRENPDFGGMPDMLDRFMYDTASALDLPVSELFGRQNSGLSDSGDGDRKMWLNGRCEPYREHHIRPRAQQLCELLIASQQGPTAGKPLKGWRVCFKPLDRPSELEASTIRLNQANADALYVTNEILLPSEVAKSRFRAEGWSAETTIDTETRDALQASELEALKTKIETPPPDPNAPPPKEQSAGGKGEGGKT